VVAKTGAVHGKHNPPTRPDLGWQYRAACRGEDVELFFGHEGERGHEAVVREEIAKQFCEGNCPVIAECRAWAITTNSSGVWGAMTHDERKGRKRAQQRQALRERVMEEA
jgi:WhiB family transcriptional regulator, redox-sensing transcriptional regulator